MSTIRARVISNSSDDEFARVRITCEGLWEESELIDSVGSIPLKEGDIVFVDISEFHNPLILGKSQTNDSEYSEEIEGSVLFESSDGSNYTIAFVKNNTLTIKTNDTEIKITGDETLIKHKSSSISLSDSEVNINNGALTIQS